MMEFDGLTAGAAASLPTGEGSFAPISAAAYAGHGSSARSAPSRKAVPEKVMQSFNTWAFKREQPTEPELMLRFISDAAGLSLPIPFVLYWGKGLRSRFESPDEECLNFLALLARRVREAYPPGAAFRLIYTDTHAALNGHSPEKVSEYFAGIEAGARQRGFSSVWLSELVRAAGQGGGQEPDVPEDMLRRLAACAAKWYRGGGSIEDGALKYYQINMIEKRAVEFAYPRSIFVTFNGSEFRSLFPERLPVFYMYSLRRGVSVKPWFLPQITDSGSIGC
jgi:hypothetical protein